MAIAARNASGTRRAGCCRDDLKLDLLVRDGRDERPGAARLYSFLMVGPNLPDGFFTQGGSIGGPLSMEATMSDPIYLAITAAAFLGLFTYARGLARL
jgi:hypothetical protein